MHMCVCLCVRLSVYSFFFYGKLFTPSSVRSIFNFLKFFKGAVLGPEKEVFGKGTMGFGSRGRENEGRSEEVQK